MRIYPILILVITSIALAACGASPAAAIPSPTAPASPIPPAASPTALAPSPTALQTPTAPATIPPSPTAAAQTESVTPTLTAAPTTGLRRAIAFDELKPRIDQIMSSFMALNNNAGCSLAIVDPAPTAPALETHLLNYGVPVRGSTKAVDAATEYEIGSLSKLFAADLLALYVRDGVMTLDDPLQKYLPATTRVPAFNGRAITLRDLATHTSGLPRRPGNIPEVRVVDGVQTLGYVTTAEMLSFVSAFTLTRAPGSQWEYSNYAFGLLGMAEEKAGSASFDSLAAAKISEPLGLLHTRANLAAADKTHLAQGYLENGQTAPASATAGEMLAAGALRSTIQDLAIYLAANIALSDAKLSPVLLLTQQKQAIGPNQDTDQGLAWTINLPGTPQEQFSKDGATLGFTAYITFSRVSRDGFAVACNGHNVGHTAVPALHKLLGKAVPPLDDSP